MASRHRARSQSQRPNKACEEPPPRRQTGQRVVRAVCGAEQDLQNSAVFLREPPNILRLSGVLSPHSPLATGHFFFYSSGVFSRPRKLDTEDELYQAALRALMRRAHSVHEMKQKLARRTDNELLLRVVMARLKENGQLDDERYAQQFTRNRTQSRKQGKFRIQRELRARGVPDRLISSALEESATQNDQAAMVRQRIKRKLKSCRGEIDDKKIASIYGSLLRAGFPSDVIRKELQRITHEAVPGFEEPSESI